MIERIQLRRKTNRAIVAAAGSGVVAVAAIVLAAAGVFSGSDEKPTVADVVKTVSPSSLLVTAETDGQPVEKGTAWVLDAKQGLLVTNNHVAQGGETLKVSVGGTSTAAARPAKIVGAAPCEDIAVIQVTGMTGLQTLPIASGL